MTTRIISCTPTWDSSDLKEATTAVKSGHLIVIPTDTVYGIGCDASNPDAVARVLAAKGRGRQMPPPVVVPGRESIETLCVDIPEVAYRLADEYWPGGLTLILRARPDLGWDLGETGGTIGVRLPAEPPIPTRLGTTLGRRFCSTLMVARLPARHPQQSSTSQRVGYGQSVWAHYP